MALGEKEASVHLPRGFILGLIADEVANESSLSKDSLIVDNITAVEALYLGQAGYQMLPTHVARLKGVEHVNALAP